MILHPNQKCLIRYTKYFYATKSKWGPCIPAICILYFSGQKKQQCKTRGYITSIQKMKHIQRVHQICPGSKTK